MIKIYFILLFFTSMTAFGQIDLDPDTVLYEQRTGGAIDTFDLYNADLPTTFAGGRSIMSQHGLSSMSLYQDLTARKFQRFTSYDPLKFSAIPHLGFAYSFGGQGAQFVRLDYSQAFTEQILFNLKYNRNSGGGFIQNSAYSENNVRAQLQRDAKRFSFQLKASYQSFEIGHSGGVLNDSETDSTIINFGLEYSSVNKSTANSFVKMGSVQLTNYLNFSPDSLNHFGLTTNHHYSITNRKYFESDYLIPIYDTSYLDSMYTEDQFNLARIRNAGGAYYSNRNSRFYLDALIEHGYWNYQNLGNYVDTNEISFITNARIKIKDFVLTNRARVNFVGAFNEWCEEAQFIFSKGDLKASGGLTIKNTAPDPFQRKYFANNFAHSLSDIENQTVFRTGAGFNWNVKDSVFSFGMKGDFTALSSIYIFDGTTWRSDSSDFSFMSLRTDAHLALGSFNIHPTIVYSMDANQYLPSFQFYSRLFLKTRLFKAKKLEALFGVDVSYTTAFNNRYYVPAMDAFDLFMTPGSSQTSSIFNLHAFVSFGIEEFRFYVRYENIGYYWSNKTNEEVFGYPVSSARLRIGVSWDFFN